VKPLKELEIKEYLSRTLYLQKHNVKIYLKGDLHSSGMLRSVDWKLNIEVSEQHIGPPFRVQAIKLLSSGRLF
jgi:hypothetical protein